MGFVYHCRYHVNKQKGLKGYLNITRSWKKQIPKLMKTNSHYPVKSNFTNCIRVQQNQKYLHKVLKIEYHFKKGKLILTHPKNLYTLILFLQFGFII